MNLYIFYRRNISCCAAAITLYQYEVRSVVDIRRNELIYIIDWYHGDLIYFIVVTVDVICFPFWHFPYFLLYTEFVYKFYFCIWKKEFIVKREKYINLNILLASWIMFKGIFMKILITTFFFFCYFVESIILKYCGIQIIFKSI